MGIQAGGKAVKKVSIVNDNFYAARDSFLVVSVLAVPGASKSEIREVHDRRLKIHIAAAPEKNKANDELRSFLAKQLGCAKKEVIIVSGEKSRFKSVQVPLYAKEKLCSLL